MSDKKRSRFFAEVKNLLLFLSAGNLLSVHAKNSIYISDILLDKMPDQRQSLNRGDPDEQSD